LGHTDQWRALATVLPRRAFGFRAVFRARPGRRPCNPRS
jgi:hypothetical protein